MYECLHRARERKIGHKNLASAPNFSLSNGDVWWQTNAIGEAAGKLDVCLMLTKFRPMNLKSVFVRVLAILAFAMAICWSSQAAQPGNTGSGRLVVQRSPAIGNGTFLRLSIDGEVHNIQPKSRYDQLIPAGHHVLIVDTPGNST